MNVHDAVNQILLPPLAAALVTEHAVLVEEHFRGPDVGARKLTNFLHLRCDCPGDLMSALLTLIIMSASCCEPCAMSVTLHVATSMS